MKRNDFLLIALVLLLSGGVFLAINIFKTEGSKVLITIEGQDYKTLDLNIDTSLTIPGKGKNFNKIIVKDGYVSMVEASCPDKICVNHNPIHYNHETIVCLPNKVVIEIIGGESNPIDSIAE